MPSHQGQGCSDGEPPRLEITVPVPRQTVQGTGTFLGTDHDAQAAKRAAAGEAASDDTRS